MSPSVHNGPGLTVDRVREYLLSQVGTRWKAGQRLPPIDSLAETLGVGRVNALRAVRQLVEEGYLESRPRLGTVVISEMPGSIERGAARREGAQVLRGKAVRLLAPSVLFDALCRTAVQEVTRRLDELGAHVRLYECTHHDPAVRSLTLHRDADAIIAINPMPGALQAGRDDQLLSVITTDADYVMPRTSRYDVVTVDSAQGGFLAGQWLAAVDADAVGFLGGVSDAGDDWERTSAVRLDAMQRGLGATVAPNHTWRARWYTIESGALLVQPYLKEADRPKALFAATDELAVGFVLGMLGQGLRPGEDYHIVGFDGQSRGRALHCGPLTTVEAPMQRMGELAVEQLLERFAEPDAPPRFTRLGCQMFEGRTAVRSKAAAKDTKD